MADQVGKDFLKRTKYEFLGPSDQMLGVPQPPLQLPFDPSAARVRLPAPRGLRPRPLDLTEAIRRRASLRAFAAKPLSLEELSYLLWSTQGVKRVLKGAATLRTAPSAGARHALETFLIVHAVEDLAPGLYRYLALEHELLRLREDTQLADRAMDACMGQSFVKTCAVVFVWAAIPYRMSWRYGERGYRYLFLDAGHVCQNLYLAAEAVGCGTCAIGAYDDDEVNRLIGLDGDSAFAIYLAAVGKKHASR